MKLRIWVKFGRHWDWNDRSHLTGISRLGIKQEALTRQNSKTGQVGADVVSLGERS
jgi:hypothetical protein